MSFALFFVTLGANELFRCCKVIDNFQYHKIKCRKMSISNTTFSERLQIFMDNKGLNDNKMTVKAGLSIGQLGKARNGTKGLNSASIEKILYAYPDLDANWLLTGEGEMLKSEKSKQTPEVQEIHHPRSVEKKEAMQVVYLYDFKASAGLRSLFDNNQHRIIDDIHIPNLPKCDGAIHIVGDSMYPLLKSGDIILYKQMPLDIENLLYGEMYLLSYDIDGEDYIVVKYVRKSGKGEPYITLGSENPEHATRDIDFRRVNALALVKASVRINSMK